MELRGEKVLFLLIVDKASKLINMDKYYGELKCYG